MEGQCACAPATEGIAPDVPEPIDGEVFETRKEDETHEDDEPRG